MDFDFLEVKSLGTEVLLPRAEDSLEDLTQGVTLPAGMEGEADLGQGEEIHKKFRHFTKFKANVHMSLADVLLVIRAFSFVVLCSCRLFAF